MEFEEFKAQVAEALPEYVWRSGPLKAEYEGDIVHNGYWAFANTPELSIVYLRGRWNMTRFNPQGDAGRPAPSLAEAIKFFKEDHPDESD